MNVIDMDDVSVLEVFQTTAEELISKSNVDDPKR